MDSFSTNNIGDSGTGIGSSGDSSNNALILSLYLIDSQHDLLPPNDQQSKNNTNNSNNIEDVIKKRARLYQRLSQACKIANDILLNSGTTPFLTQDVHNNKQSNTNSSNNYHPWSSGGDGPIFGIHCNISDINELNNNIMDGDDIWQNQLPTKEDDTNDQIDDALHSKQQQETAKERCREESQPHLRAICQYNNDINDCWRCISLLHTISSKLSNAKCSINNSSSNSERYLTCAIEVYDINDGHILLIEAANSLPNWVDNDVLQGGVGGPVGCINRCWLVNGCVHLIPPKLNDSRSSEIDEDEEVNRLSRMDALRILMESNTQEEDEGESPIMADEAVQIAIQDRINRTNYTASPSSPPTLPKEEDNKKLPPNHWHKAAVALPASIARFIQLHPNLVPLLIDSFCDNAPEYLKERESGTSSSTTRSTSSKKPFGKSYPYEQIVIEPITITKSNYAELITGRGIVPTFPTPKAYRSVELNRFHRQLCQQISSDQFGDIHDNKKGRRNPFERSVEVGIRLCAGLDWIVANNGMKMTDDAIQEQDQYSSLEEDLAINTLGEVERRLRIHWTRIDAEASGIRIEEEINESDESLPSSWIEEAWQAGPNGTSDSASIDKSLLQALQSMSKCPVFNPELSQPLYKQPCPYTRPIISLLQMVQSGIKNGLKWQRDKYTEGNFPIPRAWEVDTDDWMNVSSLQELEEEMKNLSSSRCTKADSSDTKKKPRRTTRRSRRNMTPSSKPDFDEKSENVGETGDTDDKSKHSDAMNKVQTEKLPIPAESKKSSREEQGDQPLSVEKLMSQEVNINPSKFLDILHARLKRQRNNPDEIAMGDEREEGPSNANEQEDISKFFFDEDFNNDCDSSDGSEDLMGIDDNPHAALDEEDDPFSLHNIMEAMDHELRTDVASHPTIKNLSVASEEDGSGGGTDADMAVLANLLKSIDEGDASGPLNTMLNEMGIFPPSQQTEEEEGD